MLSSVPPEILDPGDPDGIAEGLRAELARRGGAGPGSVACAPGRVNLIGEHVDYNAGRCLPLALPHATYAAVAPRDDRVLSVTSLQLRDSRQVALDGLGPGGVRGWPAYVAGVVWALEAEGWSLPGLDVVVDSRVPVGSGLSSSAALECAVAVALLPVAGVVDSAQVRRTLVDACIRAETEMVGAPTGGMDQSVVLLATEGHVLLLDFADGSAGPLPWEPEGNGLTLVAIDTRVSHHHAGGGYASRRADCEAAARALGVENLRQVQGRDAVLDRLTEPRVRRRARHVLSEMDRVDAAVEALGRRDHAALGPLLDASHESLRDDFEASCAELDLAVETCRDHGALGARMTGGGFGGSALALLPSTAVEAVMAAVADAFARRGLAAPGFLHAHAGAGARPLK